MNARDVGCVLVAAGLGLVPAAMAQTTPRAPSGGNGANTLTAAGAHIAAKGTVGVAPCASCHGAQGEGNAAADTPRLAGQPARYLAGQLQAYADGRRESAVMAPIAKAMNPAQRNAVAGWYARLRAAANTEPEKAAENPADAGGDVERGRVLAQVGDERLRVPACTNCHGRADSGAGPVYPYLAGQHASYLVAALGAWKNGTRRTDPSGQMPQIARALSERDIKAVAAFYARPPDARAVGSGRP